MSEFKALSDLLDMDMGECVDWIESNAHDNFIVSRDFADDYEESLFLKDSDINKLTEQNKLLREALDKIANGGLVRKELIRLASEALEATKC